MISGAVTRNLLSATLATCLLACCLAGAGLPRAIAQQAGEDSVNREYPLKALFLYNFGGYIEWPAEAFPSPQSPFVIGVLGTAPIDSTLNEIAASKKINGRQIVVETFGSVDRIKPCQILFVPRFTSAKEQQLVIDKLRNQPVLIVGESEGFSERGACVNFFVQANKIRFEINANVARENRLIVSAKLLALAKIVQTTRAPRESSAGQTQ